MERENLGPAREAIHELFLEHVMQHAPGYSKLSEWTSVGIMSTPNAVGKIMETIARERGIEVLGVDIGGATTDVFSVFSGIFNRTVSANLGMSYSICNVMAEAGVANIMRWIPFPIEESDLRNRLRNKMIRPTTIPQTLQDLQIEQAVSREALSLAFKHHKSLARSLTGKQTQSGIELEREAGGQTLVNLMRLNMIVGSGGVLSHAPERKQSALMMLDAYQPEGITMLAVDSIFMMPQLGVLSTVHPEAATEVFERDCLIRLGDCIAPVGTAKEGEPCLTLEFDGESAQTITVGKLTLIALADGESKQVTLTPAKNFDIGAGKGKLVTNKVQGGVVGIIIDTRCRPLAIPAESAARIKKQREWLSALGLQAAD
jgi:hypothetical protein